MKAEDYESIIRLLIRFIKIQDDNMENYFRQGLESQTQMQPQTMTLAEKLELHNEIKGEKEDSKLKVFMDIFDGLYQQNNDVEEKNFVLELIKIGKFTEEEAYNHIKKAMQNGQIYERKTGVYAKA